MPNLSLGDLITLVFDELAASVERTTDRATQLGFKIGDVDLDIPAHLRLQPEPEQPAHLFVGMPSTLETPTPGRLGRVRLTIEPIRSTEAE